MDIILSGKLFKKVEEHLEATKANREVNENLPNCSQVRLILNTPQSENETVQRVLGCNSEYYSNSFALLCAFTGYDSDNLQFEGRKLSDLTFEFLAGINASPEVIQKVQRSQISEKEIDTLNLVAHRTNLSFESVLNSYLENITYIEDNIHGENIPDELIAGAKRLAMCSLNGDTSAVMMHLLITRAPLSKVRVFEDIHSALHRGMITTRQYFEISDYVDGQESEIREAFNKCFGA